MKKIGSKPLTVLCGLVMLLTALAPAALATELEFVYEIDELDPRYVNLANISADVYISPTGMASSSGSARSNYMTDTIDLAVTLQHRRPGSRVWIETESWYTSSNYYALLEPDPIKVDSGYEYRTRVIATVNDQYGNFVESVVIYSGIDNY